MSIPIMSPVFRDFISDFRDLKLGLIKSDINLTINQKALIKYNNELIFISENLPNDIITGSLTLNLFGLIDREISDIDILIKDEKRFSGYINNRYIDNERGTIENRLGFIKFSFKNKSNNFLKNLFTRKKIYDVDFFKEINSKFIEFQFNGKILKLQHPLEIINKKMEMSYQFKHNRDLEIIFCNFDN